MKIISSKINSYTEWGLLKEVVVGNCVNLTDEILIRERIEDLNVVAKSFEQAGIVVHRPQQVDQVKIFKTPHFESHTSCCESPRDLVLIWGDYIIETPTQDKTRYFENDLLKEIFQPYFLNGAKWISAPMPTLSDASLDKGQSNADELEIMIDAAQCLRFGKDIIMNVSNRSHELGFQWLERLLRGKANLHKVSITDNSIDSVMMPLRPGLMLINPTKMKSKINDLPKGLQMWDFIEAPIITESEKVENCVCTNLMPISDKKVMAFAKTKEEIAPLGEILSIRGIEVVPVQLRHPQYFGGVHRATLDLVREDKPENYF